MDNESANIQTTNYVDSPETAPAAPNASDLQEQPLQEQKHYLLNADEVAALLKSKSAWLTKLFVIAIQNCRQPESWLFVARY